MVGQAGLKNIEDYRLEELIYKDLKAYPNSGFSEIHKSSEQDKERAHQFMLAELQAKAGDKNIGIARRD
jgi:hypothetical protein